MAKTPKKHKKKKTHKVKTLTVDSIKPAQKRKRADIPETPKNQQNSDDPDRLLSPGTMAAAFELIKNPEKRTKNTVFDPDFQSNSVERTPPVTPVLEQSIHESAAPSAPESIVDADLCPVILAEAQLEIESDFSRKKREKKWILEWLEVNADELYKKMGFGPYTPKPEDLEDFEEVPPCPVNVTYLERVGKRGRIPKAQPRCQYCDLVLIDDYHLYDHFLRHIMTHYMECPCCGRKFGGFASLQLIDILYHYFLFRNFCSYIYI